MALSDYQMSYNGLTFGAGTDIGIVEVFGLDGFTVGLGDSPIPRGDGDIVGFGRAKSRSIVLELQASGAKRSTALADTLTGALDAFAMSQDPLPLGFKEPGFDEAFVYARPTGRIVPRKPTLTFTNRPFTIRLQVADPRVYSEALTTTNFLNTTPIVLTNDGNTPSHPLITFYGPTSGTVTAVHLTNSTTGQVLDIDTTMLSGEILTADMGGIVTVSPTTDPYINLDGVNKYGDWALPREPFYLAPGNNSVAFTVTGTSTNATCTVKHRDTRI